MFAADFATPALPPISRAMPSLIFAAPDTMLHAYAADA